MGATEAVVDRGIVTLWQKPPRWVFHVCLSVPLLLGLLASTVPTMDIGPLMWGALGTLLCGVVWFVRGVTFLSTRRQGVRRGDVVWCLAAPIAVALVAILVVADLPLKARWSLSRSDFEEAVERLPRSPSRSGHLSLDGYERLGLYDITWAFRDDDVVYFEVEGTGFIFSVGGFAYVPDEVPERFCCFESATFTHFEGNWYTFIGSI